MASPRVISPQVQVPGTRQGEGRVGRRPKTDFELRVKPYQIQPFCLFPVLPGETLVNCSLQLQAWTDPLKAILKNQIWHAEAYLYYVKFRDMPGWEDTADDLGKDLIDMFETGEALTSHQVPAGVTRTGCAPYGIDFAGRALESIVDAYWRDEGFYWNSPGSPLIDGIPSAALRTEPTVNQRLTVAANYEDRRQALDFDGTSLTVDDIELAYREWASKKDDTVAMDYEDWVRAAGGKAVTSNDEREVLHRPEELIGVREYSYPTNTVDPLTGTPSVAVGWRWRKGQRKMFRFEEWGWVIGVVCFRPKALDGNKNGLLATMMNTRDHWFPPNMDPRSWSPHINMLETAGPWASIITAGNASYWMNLRDLMRYGEQFTNFTQAASDGLSAATDIRAMFPAAADVTAPFTDTANGRVRVSGVIQCGFKTHKVIVAAEEAEGLYIAKW